MISNSIAGFAGALALGALGLSAVISAALIVLLRPLLVQYALARPNARSSHVEPTPQGGGIAVITATAVVALLAAFASSASEVTALVPVLAGAAVLALLGAVDDIRTVGVGLRLAVQTATVAAVVLALPSEARLLPTLPQAIESAALVMAGVWLVNLVNFMDGLDLMTVAEVVPVTGAIVLLSALGFVSPLEGALALALMGAMLGFAYFNRPVARIFLGDVGSLPIGLILGWLLLQLALDGHAAAALLLPLYYLADATLTLLRRLARGERITQSHRTHFYQRATLKGLSVSGVVGRVFAANLALAALAVATAISSSAWVDLGALAAGGTIVALLLRSFARGKG